MAILLHNNSSSTKFASISSKIINYPHALDLVPRRPTLSKSCIYPESSKPTVSITTIINIECIITLLLLARCTSKMKCNGISYLKSPNMQLPICDKP